MKYKLIVSDVDGTLFKSGNQVQQRTVQLIHQYQQEGGIFTLATGRMKKAIEPFIQKLKIQVPVIVYNGAQVVDPLNDRLILSHELSPLFAEKALKIMDAFSVSPIVHIQQQPYVKEYNDDILAHTKKDGIDCVVTDNLSNLVLTSPTKILVIGEPLELAAFEKVLKQKTLIGYQTVYSDRNYLELLPEEASKGNALDVLAKTLGVLTQDILAVGDERNDISMLVNAGMGVAVANAAEEVKQRADMVTKGSWNNGLEEVLEAALKNEI